MENPEQPLAVYRYSVLYRLVYILFLLPVSVLIGTIAVYCAYSIISGNTGHSSMQYFVGFLGCGLIFLLMLYDIMCAFSFRLLVYSDRLVFHYTNRCSLMRQQTYYLRKIIGFQKVNNAIILHYDAIGKSRAIKRRKFIYSVFGKKDNLQLRNWIEANLSDYDQKVEQLAQSELLSAVCAGPDKEKLVNRLNSARKEVSLMNCATLIAALVLLLAYFFAPGSQILLLFWLPVCAFITLYNDGLPYLIRIKPGYPSFGNVVMTVSFLGALLVFTAYEICTWSAIIAPLLLSCVILLIALCVMLPRERKPVTGFLVSGFIITLFYSFTLVLNINCRFDRSRPAVKFYVIEKAIVRGSAHSFVLKPVKPEDPALIPRVPPNIFSKYKKGETVSIYEKPGTLGIRWRLPLK